MDISTSLVTTFNVFAQSLVGRKVLHIDTNTVHEIRRIIVCSSSAVEVELVGFFPNDTNSFALHELSLLPVLYF